MSSYGFQTSFTFAGEQYENVPLEYGGFGPSEGEGAYWMVALPAVLRMLRAAESGEAAVGDIRATLLAAITKFSERSGCCPDCDYAADSYAKALRAYEAALDDLRRIEAAMTPETHPYVVASSGKVHTWNCQTRPAQRTIEHPGHTLQEYAHRGRAYLGAGYFTLQTAGSAKRMTAAELTEWLGRRKTPVKRCKLCEPALPGAYGSEASDVEATGTR